MSTSGNLDTSLNKLPMPPSLKIARNVVGSAWHASVKLVVSCGEVTPNGMPISVVTMMEIKMAPFTFKANRTIVKAKPIRKTQNCGSLNVDSAGTPPPKLIMPTFKRPI